LERRFDRPALRVTRHDLLWLHPHICCQEVLVAMGPCTIMNVSPTDVHKCFPNTVRVFRARDDLYVSTGAPILGHCEADALGSVRRDLVGGGHSLAFHGRTSHRAARAWWLRLVQRGIAVKLADHVMRCVYER
jgi:hypothetical protein